MALGFPALWDNELVLLRRLLQEGPEKPMLELHGRMQRN